MNSFKLTNICRTCMATTDGMTSIFSPTISPTIDSMITAISSLLPLPDDNLPSKICRTCLNSLEQAYTFRKKIINTNNTFQNTQPVNSKCNEVISLEIVLSDDSNQEFDDNIGFCNDGDDSEDASDYVVVKVTDEKEKTKLDKTFGISGENDTKQNLNLKPKRTEKKFVCTYCPRGFSHQCSLNTHIRQTHKDTLYTCKYCGKGFIVESAFKIHEKRHSGKKPFLCKVCNKGFKRQEQLKKHEPIHGTYITDEGHKCKKCKQVFKWKCHLDRHAWVHTGKPHQCEHCKVKFATLVSLKRHLRTYH